MTPKWITFTGIDARTDLLRCHALSQTYPIEWGILTGGRLGRNRYPDESVIGNAVRAGLRLALHMCGPDAAWINSGARGSAGVRAVVLDIIREGLVERVQVNRAEGCYDLPALEGALRDLHIPQMILQHRGPVFPEPHETDRIVWLHDESGGRGRAVKDWAQPSISNQFVGYAGGLSPETVAGEISRMPAESFWIDMETGVRTEDWLDLDRCEAVCRAVYG